MDDAEFKKFRNEILKLGFHGYDEQMSLFQIAKRCAKTTGLAMGGMGAAGTAALGPGAAAGFLAGLATGTLTCGIGSTIYREEIKRMLAEDGG